MRGNILTRFENMRIKQWLWQLPWSTILFYATIALFLIEAGWIAFKSAMPMAYDESFHIGLIQVFTDHLNPVLSQQHPSTFGFGNIVHNPSWLYHWLLSFPDRVLTVVSDSLRVEVLGLRAINIGFGLASLFVLRRILGQFGLSNALRTFVVFLVALTPTFTILSAQVNYDNLVVLATLLATSLTLTAVRQLQDGQPSSLTVASLLLVLLYGSLVKFSFIPICIAVVLILVVAWFRSPLSIGKLWGKLEHDFDSVRPWLQAVVVAAVIVGVSLFSLFYVQNVVRYHNPSPSCERVLNVEACSQYYAWARNYALAQAHTSSAGLDGPLVYTYHWLVTCWYQLYGVILPWGGIEHIAKPFYGFLLLVTGAAGLSSLVFIRRLLRTHPQLIITTTIALVYLLVLWARNFNDYRHLGEAVAVQGRYIMPVLAFFYLFLVLGIHVALPRTKWWELFRRSLTGLIVAVLLWYGGTLLYVRAVLPIYSWGTTMTRYR